MDNVPIFVIFFAFLFVLHKTSFGVDTLTSEHSIVDGQELTSSGQTFVLGFFGPGSTKDRYVGIWYKDIIPQTVVWVANRNKPLNDSHGNLAIGAGGNLVLLDGAKNIVWSTRSPRVLIQEPCVKLLDSGNLVLMSGDSSGNSIWQSFDYPTDTLLPGMRFGWDKNSGLNRYLTSWKSPNDPSKGNFTYTFDHTEFPEMVIRQGPRIMFRAGIWNGVQVNADPWSSFTAFKPKMSVTSNEVLYWDEPGDRISRFVMRDNGLAERYIWDNQTLSWVKILEARKDFCDNYGACGVNGICNINDVPVYCDCLKGFKPESLAEWNAFNWSSGCTRRTPLGCNKGDKFEKLSWVKLPMLLQFWTQNSLSLEECKVECLKNCSCTAYAYSGMDGGPHGCLIWFGDLVDMRLLLSKEGAQQDLYVRLAASEVGMDLSMTHFDAFTMPFFGLA